MMVDVTKRRAVPLQGPEQVDVSGHQELAAQRRRGAPVRGQLKKGDEEATVGRRYSHCR